MLNIFKCIASSSLLVLCVACGSQIDHPALKDGASRQIAANATADLASLSSASIIPPSSHGGVSLEKLDSIQQHYPASDLCTVLDGCKQTLPLQPASAVTSPPASADPPRTGGAGTHNQTSIYPDMNVDLVQLPGEASIQYVNGIYTSLVKDKQHADLSQKTEFKNVRFNQIRAPSSMNTINMVVTDDKSVSGNLDQSFKFKSIEMIQRDSAGSVHAMNYLGDSTR